MTQIYGTMGTVILGYLASTHAVGVYAVASKLPWALVALANIWLSVFFPHTAQRLLADRVGFAQELGKVVTATLVVALAIIVGAALCAGTLMVTMFGTPFRAAALPFVILSASAALVLLQASFSNVLLASGSQRYFVVCMTLAAASIVLFNVVLIPAFGTTGAASATLAGEVGLTTLTFVGVRRRLGPIRVDADRVLRGAVAVAAMAAAMLAVRPLGGAVVQVAFGIPTFLSAAAALGAFDLSLIRG
jgi:O-antigen/teichoic acid export membrane protein